MRALTTEIFHLAECPVWDAQRKTLFWVDILNGEIWEYPEVSGMARRIFKSKALIGGIALCKDGNLLACTTDGVLKIYYDGTEIRQQQVLFSMNFEADERFNDITIDPAGRLLAGTKRDDLSGGKLILYEQGMAPRTLLSDLHISNGMTFSADHKTFFHTDSLTFTITRYDYDLSNGQISNPEVFYLGSAETGYPDGITMDNEGRIWVAFWGSSCVRALKPNGQIEHQIAVPALQPSSLTFGGGDMSTLFITTACEGGTDLGRGLDENGNFLGGHVYTHDTGISGRKDWLANF